jgi:DNA-directed RNA polymerase specialized sigma24 family protein
MVVLLRFRDQLSYEVISKLTGERPGALRVRLVRALRTLRRRLETKEGRREYGGFETDDRLVRCGEQTD